MAKLSKCDVSNQNFAGVFFKRRQRVKIYCPKEAAVVLIQSR